MPLSFDWLPGGTSEKATEPFVVKAAAKFRNAGWLDALSAESLARINHALDKRSPPRSRSPSRSTRSLAKRDWAQVRVVATP